MRKKVTQNKAFSLTEITVVIIIIATLVSLALPRYNSIIEKSRSAEGVNVLEALRKAQWAYFYENNGAYTSVLTDLDVTIPTLDGFNAPSVTAAANALASITRNGGSGYTLTIADDGDISCAGPGNICNKMGF